MNKFGWTETDSQSGALATATKAAVAGKQYVLGGVSASYATTQTGLLQVKDGTTVIYEAYVYDSLDITFPEGIAITPGNSVSAELAAGSGIGKVNIHGVSFG